MTINLHSATVPTFVRMLKNARTWLDKAAAHAEAKKFDSKNFMTMRLVADMLPFSSQIMIATDHAKGCTARLAGMEVPKYEDTETTFAELQARIDKTIAFVESVPAEKFAGDDNREIVMSTRARGDIKFTAKDYALAYAMGNFYFHLTTAYAILRSHGVDIGKLDYLGKLI
ncbi:MAG TPA: DUF1993 domain-containing protein [Myxococcota bacterium]|jgi:hypothetical protein